MLNVNPQFIKDSNGNNSMVVLSIKEFDSLMEELEELEDIKLYDQVKLEDKGERILFDDCLLKRKSKNA